MVDAAADNVLLFLVVSLTLKPPPATAFAGGLLRLSTTRSGVEVVETVKVTPLLGVPLTVTTTGPVVAVSGTTAMMDVSLQLVMFATAPLKVTKLVPWTDPKLDPLIVTDVPTLPKFGEMLVMLGGGRVQRKAEGVPPRFWSRKPLL